MRETSFRLADFDRGLLAKGAADDLPSDCRCDCGSLMAKITSRGVEIKCRRCKRLKLIRYKQVKGCFRPA